jgi:hypothetical protein
LGNLIVLRVEHRLGKLNRSPAPSAVML